MYVKNRVYNKSTIWCLELSLTPYQNIRGSCIRAYTSITRTQEKWHKCQIGFVPGYAEDAVGCKVYFPDENIAKFVSDVRVNENIVYRDRHVADVEEVDLSSLHFNHDDEEQSTSTEDDIMSALSNFEATRDIEYAA